MEFTKHLRLYRALFKASLVADLEFRANFASRIVIDIFWYLAQIITFETIFHHTERIGSWNLSQTRVFLGILFVTDAIYMVLFHDNLDKMSDRVRKGELDLLLAKPVNSQFMISLQRANTAIFGNLILGLSWLSWSLSQMPDFPWVRLWWLAYLIPVGVTCLYAFRFMFGAAAVIFTKSDNLQFVWYQIYRLGMRPDSIYSPWLKYLILSIVPVAIVASVPSRALLDEPRLDLFLWVGAVALTFLYLSAKFWRFSLRFYTSASS